MKTLSTLGAVTAASLLALTAACSDAGPAAPELEAPVLLSVQPRGGATGVDRHADVEVEFDHAMREGMEAYADLHEGEVTGPVVPGTWSMSEDRMRLLFQPDAPLKAHTDYTIHLGGGIRGENGHHADFEEHGQHMGGRWATDDMMNGDHRGDGHGGHGQGGQGDGDRRDQGHHMGDGWEHANGSYGMVFTFTTGA